MSWRPRGAPTGWTCKGMGAEPAGAWAPRSVPPGAQTLPQGKPDLGTDHRCPLLGLAQIGNRGPKFGSQTPGVTRGGHMPL